MVFIFYPFFIMYSLSVSPLTDFSFFQRINEAKNKKETRNIIDYLIKPDDYLNSIQEIFNSFLTSKETSSLSKEARENLGNIFWDYRMENNSHFKIKNITIKAISTLFSLINNGEEIDSNRSCHFGLYFGVETTIEFKENDAEFLEKIELNKEVDLPQKLLENIPFMAAAYLRNPQWVLKKIEVFPPLFHDKLFSEIFLKGRELPPQSLFESTPCFFNALKLLKKLKEEKGEKALEIQEKIDFLIDHLSPVRKSSLELLDERELPLYNKEVQKLALELSSNKEFLKLKLKFL